MRAKKVDTTHNAIADHLRSIGWSVFSTAGVARNFPDLCVSRCGFTALVECKTGYDERAEVYLTEGQREFRDRWQGAVVVACSPEQAEQELADRYLGFRLEMLASDEVEP